MKKLKCKRIYWIDAFELCCWRRLLRVPWTARRPNQWTLKKSVLNVLWKDWCWEWSSNALSTWCKELTHWKNPGAGKDWRWDEKGTTEVEMVRWHHWVNGHEFEQDMGSWWWTGKPGMLQSMRSQRVWLDWATELNWKKIPLYYYCFLGFIYHF